MEFCNLLGKVLRPMSPPTPGPVQTLSESHRTSFFFPLPILTFYIYKVCSEGNNESIKFRVMVTLGGRQNRLTGYKS